jgi:hypothetical protein
MQTASGKRASMARRIMAGAPVQRLRAEVDGHRLELHSEIRSTVRACRTNAVRRVVKNFDDFQRGEKQFKA